MIKVHDAEIDVGVSMKPLIRYDSDQLVCYRMLSYWAMYCHGGLGAPHDEDICHEYTLA